MFVKVDAAGIIWLYRKKSHTEFFKFPLRQQNHLTKKKKTLQKATD